MSDESLVVGHVGRFEEQKNHAFLLEVGREIVRRRAGCRLLLVGDGSLKGETEARARELGLEGVATFAGPRSDVADLLAAMDVFLFPSHFEGLGLAAVEAQAVGLHVVMAEGLPAEATVRDSLVTRLPLAAGPGAWADAVLRAPRPCPETRAAALGWLRGGLFDVRTSAEKLVEFYESLPSP